MHTASLSPLPSDSRKLMPAPATANPTTVTTVAIVKRDAAPPAAQTRTPSACCRPSSPRRPTTCRSRRALPEPAAKPRSGGWMIQVGAFPEENEAKQRLTAAQEKAKDQLGQADPFTERITKGDKALFRARFAGLDKDQAETACKHLKRSEIPCMLLKN